MRIRWRDMKLSMNFQKADIKARLIGGIYFMPILGLVGAGPPWFILGCILAGFWVVFETFSLIIGRKNPVKFITGLGLLSVAFGLPFIASPVYWLVLGVCLWVGIVALTQKAPFFMACLTATCISLGAIAQQPAPMLLFGIIIIVTSFDMGAYFAGRLIGGPKLAPKISPSKTWAGSIGGLICVMLLCEAGAWIFLDAPLTAHARLFIALCALCAQAGDLLESALKRKLSVKDSGHFVPGHGGALDRFDGYLLTLPFVTLLDMLHLMPPDLFHNGI